MDFPKRKGGIQFKKEAHRIIIKKPWKRVEGLVFMFIVAMLMALLFFSIWLIPLFSFAYSPFSFVFISLLIPACLLLACSFFYWGLKNLYNTTSILIDGELLTRVEGPLPYSTEQHISKTQILQFFVQALHTAPEQKTAPSESLLKKNFQLAYVNDAKQMKALLGHGGEGALTPEEAEILELLLESHFGITDELVVSEIERNSLPNQKVKLLATPLSLMTEESDKELLIVKRWHDAHAFIRGIYVAAVMTVIMSIILLPILYIEGSFDFENIALGFLIFLAVILLISFLGTLLFDSSTSSIHATVDSLKIRHWYNPFKRRKEIPMNQIDRFELVRTEKKDKRRTYYVYSLYALGPSNKRVLIISDTGILSANIEELRYLKIRLNRYLQETK